MSDLRRRGLSSKEGQLQVVGDVVHCDIVGGKSDKVWASEFY
jgi:hypothetical protein